MSPGNFACNIQSEPETAVSVVSVLLSRTALERVKDLVQSRLLDSGARIPDLEAKVGLLASNHHADRLIRRSVLDRVRNQVAEQLLQPQAVSETPGVACHLQYQPAVYLRPGVQRRQVRGCHLDGLKRTAHIVPEHPK